MILDKLPCKKIIFLSLLIVFLASAVILISGNYNTFFSAEPPYHPADIEPDLENYRNELQDMQFEEEYNVIVTGSDPEGIAAALASARNGLETLLIDERDKPGGLMVKGGLNTIDMNYGPGGELLTRGIFEEVFEQLEGVSFNTETAAEVFQKMMEKEDNLTWKDGYSLEEPILDDDQVVGISVESKEDSREVKFGTQRLIDATQKADIAAMAGVPYTRGMEDIGREDTFQAATLVFELENIDWEKARDHLNTDGNPHSGGDERSLWGFSEEMQRFESSDPGLAMRGLNVGREEGDRALVNSLHIADLDPLDEDSRRQGRSRAETEIEEIIKHIRSELPGFSEVKLKDTADELYIRQSRHIKGQERLNINHLREHKDFEDKIALGSYPVDIQRTTPFDDGFVLFDPKKYSIPFGSIVPREIDNLLIAGKSASYDSLAHGSARVIPVGMALGEAAGVASRVSLESDLTFREMSESEEYISEIQSRLEQQGAYLEDFSHPPAGDGEESWAREGIRYFNSLGILIAGYENEYGFEDNMPENEFYSRLQDALDRGGGVDNISLPIGNEDEYITRDKALKSLADAAEAIDNISSTQDIEKGEFKSSSTASALEKDQDLSRQAAYQLILEFMEATDLK